MGSSLDKSHELALNCGIRCLTLARLLNHFVSREDLGEEISFNHDDPVISRALSSIDGELCNLEEYFDYCEKEGLIVDCVNTLAEVYRSIKSGKIASEDALISIQRYKKKFYGLGIAYKKLQFLVPDIQQMTEAGGPKELARLKLALLLDKSESTLHNIRRRVTNRLPKKVDFEDDNFLAYIFINVLNISEEALDRVLEVIYEYEDEI